MGAGTAGPGGEVLPAASASPGDVPPPAPPGEVPADPRQLPPAPLHERLGIELTEVGPDRCAGRMPVTGNTQPFGLLHGGASCVLAEGLASIAATLYAGPGRAAVGVDINATHHRAARSGYVHGVATPVHRGRTIATYEVVIVDDDGQRVCTARLTCQLRDGVPGAAAAS